MPASMLCARWPMGRHKGHQPLTKLDLIVRIWLDGCTRPRSPPPGRRPPADETHHGLQPTLHKLPLTATEKGPGNGAFRFSRVGVSV